MNVEAFIIQVVIHLSQIVQLLFRTAKIKIFFELANYKTLKFRKFLIFIICTISHTHQSSYSKFF